MNVWQKKIMDRLCALGDFLRTHLVAAIAGFLDRLTFRRIMFIAGLVVLAIGFAQIFTLDTAILFAGNMMVYFDLAALVALIVARQHLQQIVPFAAAAIRRIALNLLNILRRAGSRQRRNANALRRKEGADGLKQSDDEPAGWGTAVFA
jgi:hypothetical protein